MKHSDYLKKKKTRETRKKIISVISAIVVFITTYALVLPAITLDVSRASREPGIAYEQMQFKATASAASVTAADSTVEEVQVEEPAAEEAAEEEIIKEEAAEIPEEETSAVSDENEKEEAEQAVEEAPAESAREEAPAAEAEEVQEEEDKSAEEKADAEPSSEPAREEAQTAETQKSADQTAVDQSGKSGAQATEAAAAASTEETAAEFQIPTLDPIDFDEILTGKTDFYFYHVEKTKEDENITSDSVDDWKKVGSDTVLAPEDFVRVYLSYEIPAGSLNETNVEARYRLPAGLELSDKQIKDINKYENGIAASKSGREHDKYLGAEAIEGSRTPDEKAGDEYISATVKVEKTNDGGQELVFTFIPYTVEKNQISYDKAGKLASEGRNVKGFFTFDLTTAQIEFEKTEKETVEKEDGTTEETQYSKAEVVFVKENNKKNIDEISRTLTMAGPVEKEEPQAKVQKTLVSKGEDNDYTVTVSYTDDAQIPDNAELAVREIEKGSDEYASYLERAKGAVDENKSVNEARFFDITIMADGEKVEPQAPVNVQINFNGIVQTNTDDTQLLHYKDDNEVEVMEKAEFSKSEESVDETKSVDTVQFEADGFSVYGIVGMEAISAQVITESGDTLQVTVEVTDKKDIARFNGLRVDELTSKDAEFWEAYDAVVAEKQAKDENFDEETFGFFAADIALLDENENEFEPEGSVNVKMELISLPADADTLTSSMEVQHLAEKNGEIDVQTVATAEDVKTVDSVITADFTVESFSTFTLTWTGDGGESDVISPDDAKAVLNINSGSETYATVNIHYVDIYGNNIRSPFTTAVDGTTPVSIAGLLDGEIAGYEYKGAFYNSYAGDEISTIAVSRLNGVPTENYVSQGTTRTGNTNGGRPYGWTPSTTETYYGDINGSKARVYYRNISGTWRFMTSETQTGSTYRYVGGTVYTRETVTTYDYTLTLSNNDSVVATATNNAVGTWNDAADICLVYESTDTSLKHATIHFGTLNPDGSFTELQESTSLDTNAASISLKASISGYEYVGSYYCESATDTPAEDSVTIMSTLRKVEDAWQYTDTSEAANTGFVVDGSHIYVTLKEKSGSGTPTPSEGEIPTPSTIKNVIDNDDGTYNIQLDIIGQEITHEETKGANVLLIFDRTSSMSSQMSGADNRFEAAKSAVRTLVTALNPGTNPVEMAVFSFDRNANDGISWTTSGTDITDYTNALTMAASGATPGAGGTNWEAAFAKAKDYLASADSDPTYVIFLTDGNPTIYVGSNTVLNNRTANDPEYTRARTEASGLSSSLKLYGILCANQSDGPLLQTLVDDLNSAAYGSHDMTHILANDSTTLTNTFNNIASHIVEQLGASNVSTQDGVTSLSSVSATVSGAAGAFNYYKAYEVTQRDGHYYYVDDNGTEQEVAATDVQEYSYQDSDGNEKSYMFYNRTTWAGAPGAAYSAESGVTWDLGSEGKLNEGAIYSVSFTVWPSQAAYDLLADLNNGIKVYEPGHDNSITEAERNQVYESGGVYYMKTNTTLDTTYSFGNATYTDNIPYHQGAMDLDAEIISLLKQWPENMLDQYGAATYRDENGVEHTATEITLQLTKDKADYLPVTVKASEGWKKGDVYISCGVMTVDQNGVADVKEHGHDYTVTEPTGFSYYWDLIADVYHPMVINGVTTMLLLDEDATDAMVDNSSYYKIDGKIYRKQEADELVLKADNYRRSNLNITKKIEPANPNAPEDAKFRYTVTVTDAESTDGYVWFSAWDPVAGATVKDASWVKSGATAQEGNTGYWYAPNGGTVVFEIEAGWNVRYLNLKHNSTFSIEETGSDDGFSFVEANESIQFELLKEVDWCDIDEEKAEGTIPEPNNSYTVTYTNKYDTIDIQLKKVDDKDQPLSGATFTLARQQGTAWVNIRENIKPGDTTTSTANPVDLGGLGVGNYRLTENEAPDGYIILSNHVDFEVYKEGTELKARLEEGTKDATIEGPGTGETPTYTIKVKNTPGQELPMTGGSGTLPYTLGGLMLVIASALMYGFRMRRRERRLN